MFDWDNAFYDELLLGDAEVTLMVSSEFHYGTHNQDI